MQDMVPFRKSGHIFCSPYFRQHSCLPRVSG